MYTAHVKSAIHISTKPCKSLQMWSKPHHLHSTSSSYWCYTTGLIVILPNLWGISYTTYRTYQLQ